MIHFKDVKVGINGTGILADSASVSVNNDLIPVFAVGKKGLVNMTPNGGLGGSVSFNYLLEPGNEPVNGICKYIKDNTQSSYQSVIVEVGGITGSYFLDSYSVRTVANDAVSAAASFITYFPVSGELSASPTLTFNPRENSGIAHSYTTTFFNGGEKITTGQFSSFDYQFKANWNPVYTLGKKEPTHILLTSADERFEIEREFFKNITMSGDYLGSYVNIDKVKIFELSYLVDNTGNFIDFEIDNHFVRAVTSDARLDDIAKVRISAEKTLN
jgi:hypothetical protein